MIIDLDSWPGEIVVSDAEHILGTPDDQRLTPDQARALAADLDRGGEHTVAAEGLRRAADQAARNPQA